MRRKFRLFLWFFKAFLKKYFKVIIFGSTIGIAVFFFYSRFGYLIPRSKKTTRIGLVGRFSPQNLPLSILGKISRGLVRINPDGSVMPDLTENWEVEEDGRVYIFHLKKDLSWQDGTPLKAGDINLQLEGVELEPKNDFTLKFKLKEPFSPFPTTLNQPVFKRGFLGVSKYKVTSIKSSGNFVRSMKLENDEVLVFKFYPTEKAAIIGFKLGEVDELRNISEIDEFENWPRIRIASQLKRDQFVAVFFNLKNESLATKSFRQALAYSIKKPVDKSRALGPFNPDSWTYNSQVKPYDYNLDKAKELLTESKIEEIEIELTTTFSQLYFAEEIKKSWEQLGVKTIIRVISTLPEDFQAFLASQEIPPDPDQYTLWHSTQRTNITGYNDPRVDKLLEEGRKTLDEEKRKAIYLDFQRFLVEDTPAAFLFHPNVYTIYRQD